jgi:hypothetical protein
MSSDIGKTRQNFKETDKLLSNILDESFSVAYVGHNIFGVFILIILFAKQTTFWNPKIVGSFWLEIYASHK